MTTDERENELSWVSLNERMRSAIVGADEAVRFEFKYRVLVTYWALAGGCILLAVAMGVYAVVRSDDVVAVGSAISSVLGFAFSVRAEVYAFKSRVHRAAMELGSAIISNNTNLMMLRAQVLEQRAATDLQALVEQATESARSGVE